MRKETFTQRPEARVAQLAKRDHGVLTTQELIACGMTHAGIHRRSRAGRLHRLHRGVYAVGHGALSREGRLLAAVKACGPSAVISHQAAAELWELATRCPGPIHVTVPYGRNPSPDVRIKLHRSRTLTPSDTTRRNRIAVTTPARTLLDLRRTFPREQWEDAIDRARARGFPVAAVADEPPTRSRLERNLLRLCRRHRIPAPRVNVRVGRFLVDFLWPESRLIIEVDGYEFHRNRASFEADRGRDAELTRWGFRVVRFTYRQVNEQPAHVAKTIRELLRPGPL
jgi:very-short-patch-repair endonuclease